MNLIKRYRIFASVLVFLINIALVFFLMVASALGCEDYPGKFNQPVPESSYSFFCEASSGPFLSIASIVGILVFISPFISTGLILYLTRDKNDTLLRVFSYLLAGLLFVALFSVTTSVSVGKLGGCMDATQNYSWYCQQIGTGTSDRTLVGTLMGYAMLFFPFVATGLFIRWLKGYHRRRSKQATKTK